MVIQVFARARGKRQGQLFGDVPGSPYQSLLRFIPPAESASEKFDPVIFFESSLSVVQQYSDALASNEVLTQVIVHLRSIETDDVWTFYDAIVSGVTTVGAVSRVSFSCEQASFVKIRLQIPDKPLPKPKPRPKPRPILAPVHIAPF